MPQSADQKRLEKRISELADDFLPYRGVFDFGDARRLMHPISLDDDTRPAMIPGNIPQS